MMADMLPGGSTIGIIGGGQLGRMLAMAAAKLGLETTILDPDENSPAFQVANHKIIAPYDNQDALAKLASNCDVITFEFENIPTTALEKIDTSTAIHPNAKALSTSQDRLIEKQFFNDLGIATAPFYDCPDMSALNKALSHTNGKGILKTRRFGYDGKGQVRLGSDKPKSLEQAKEMISQSPSILEGFVAFEKEISVIAARDQQGNIECYDPAENVHENGILATSTLPSHVDETCVTKAKEIAAKVLSALDYVGIIGIEFFVMADGSLIVNEFAPRVHNSGHWSEAACAISQFEQHIRAITGLPLGNTDRHSDCVMHNLIGSQVENLDEILKNPNCILHLYGKKSVREGRKMGHYTIITKKPS